MSFWPDPYLFLVNWLKSLLTGWGVPDATASFLLMFAGGCLVALQVFQSNDVVFWWCAGLMVVSGALGGGLVALGAWKDPDSTPPR